MTSYKLGILISNVVLDPIIDWKESKISDISIFELINKTADVDENVWLRRPKMQTIICRMNDTDKLTLTSIYEERVTKTWFEDDIPVFDLFLVEVRFEYKMRQSINKPWIATISFVKIPLPSFEIWIIVSPLSGVAPLTINCDVYIYGGTAPYTYDWDWGDSTPNDTTKIATHEYGDSGTFNGTLTVIDSALQQRQATFQIIVTPQGDIYRTVGIRKVITKNSVGERPPAMTVNITKSISKNSIAQRPDAMTVNITKVLDTDVRNDSISSLTTNITTVLDTDVNDDGPIPTVNIAYVFSKDLVMMVFDDGGVAFWTLVAGTESNDAGVKIRGADSYKVILATQTLDAYHDYASNTDFSGKTDAKIWVYGANTGTTIRLEFWNEVYASKTNGYYYTITDNFTGWQEFSVARASFTDIGTPTGWDLIRCVRLLGSGAVIATLWFDYYRVQD